MMPRLDGLGLVKAIRAAQALRSLPVILLSARPGPEAAACAIDAGADDYVIKPFAPGELLARCRTSLELAEYRKKSAASQPAGAMAWACTCPAKQQGPRAGSWSSSPRGRLGRRSRPDCRGSAHGEGFPRRR